MAAERGFELKSTFYVFNTFCREPLPQFYGPRQAHTEAERFALHWKMFSGDHEFEEAKLLCMLAHSILSVPCSEASVERVFSHLWRLHTAERELLGTDYIEAMIRIRNWLSIRHILYPAEYQPPKQKRT